MLQRSLNGFKQALPDPRARIAAGFRAIVSGDPNGRPDWVKALEGGDDEGYFGPGSAVWAVHGDLTTLIGGVRALLMQALHPAAVTGVDRHSTYREDPLGRLSGTARWLTTTTFAARAGADREAARVRGMHGRVVGTYPDVTGRELPYRADDERLLAWVHAAFTDSFLATHLVFGGPIPGGPDAYVGQWATSAQLIGLPQPPRSAAQLDALIDDFGPELAYTEATARTLKFLRNPPLPLPARIGYQVLLAAAISTLRPEHRELLRLPNLGTRAPQAAGSALLRTMRLVLKQGPPAAAAARRRVAGSGRDWVLRRADVSDAHAIAEFQTRCWAEAYRGLVPQDYLDRMTVAERETRWRDRLVAGERGIAVATLRAPAGARTGPEQVIGVASWRRSDTADGPSLELKTLYVDAGHRGSGVAKALLELAIGRAPATLWVFEDNARARAFYDKQGFGPDGTRVIDTDTGIWEIRLTRPAPQNLP